MTKNMGRWAAACVVAVRMCATALATDGTWSSTSDGNWSDAANWIDGNVASGTGASAYFTNGTAVTVWQNLGSLTLGNLFFANASTMLTNNAIALSASSGEVAITVDGNSVTADVGVVLSPTAGAKLTKAGTGTLLLNKSAGAFGWITLNDGLTLVGRGVGGDGLNVGTNTITINSGATLRYLDVNLINNYAVLDVKSGGVLDFKGCSDNIGAITGDGVVTNTPGLQLWLNGQTRKFSGLCYGGGSFAFMQPGVFEAGGSNSLENVSITLNYPGILSFAPGVGTYYIGSLSATNKQTLALQDTAGAPITLALGSRNDTFSLVPELTGLGGLTKVGTGTMTLTNVQSYAGATVVNGGTLRIGDGVNDGAVTNTRNYTLGASGTLAFNTLANRTNTAPLYGSGYLTKTLPSTLVLNAYNTSNNAVTVSAGTLAINGGSYMAGSFAVTAGAQLAFNGGSGTGATLTVSSAIPIQITGGTHQFASPIGQNNARYVQTGGSSQFIGAQGNSNTNVIFATISGGTLSVANYGAWPQGLGLLICSNAAVTISDYPGKGQRLASDGKSHEIIITNNASLTADSLRLISPGGAVASTGTLSLAGGTLTIASISSAVDNSTNSYIFVNFNGGLLKLTSSMTMTTNLYTSFRVFEGGARINGGSLQNQIDPPLINGTGGGVDGGLSKYGSGVLVLSTNATYTGQTTAKAGTLRTTSADGAPFGSGSVFINGGTLQAQPAGSGLTVKLALANGDATKSFAYGPGPSTFNFSKMNDSSATLTLGNSDAAAYSVLVRTNGGVLAVTPANGTGSSNLGANEKVRVNGGVAMVNGMASSTIAGIGTDSTKAVDFLNYDVTKGFVLPTYTAGLAGGATSLANVSSSTSADSAQVYALRIQSGITVTMNAGQTLTVGDGVNPAGVILNNSSTSRAVVTNGTLDFGASEGVVWFNQNSSAGGARISSTITGAGGLTLVGGGTSEGLTLDATNGNAYAGGTRIMAGRVNVAHSRGFGDGDVFLYGNENSGGQFLFDLAGTVTNAFHVSGIGTLDSPYFGAVRFAANAALSGSVELMEDTRVGADSLKTGTFGGTIGGLGGLEICGTDTAYAWGQIILNGVNTYAGSTKINNGTLQIGATGTLGQGPVVNNATLLFNNSADMTVTNAISGAGRIVKSGPGKLTLSGANTCSGGIQVDSGSLSIGAGLTVQSSVLNVNGLIDLNGTSLSVGHLAGTGTVSATSGSVTLTVGADHSDSQYRGVIANGLGTVSLIKAGAGTLALSGQSTYSGSTVVGAGTLKLQSLATLPTNGLAYRLDATDASKLTLSGTNISTWADSTAAGVNFTQSVAVLQPVYVTNAISGLAAVRFEGMTNCMGSSKAALVQTAFIVNKVRGYMDNAGLWGQNNGDYSIRQANLTTWSHPGNGNDFSCGGQMFVNGVETNTFASGAAHVLTAVSLTCRNWATALGDCRPYNGTLFRSYKGDVGEVVVYTNTLLAADRQTVEAYLNYKWFGIGAPVASNVLSTATALSVSNNAALDLNGVSQTLASLSGAGSVINGSGAWSTLTVGSDGTSTLFSGAIAGSNALVKVDGGTLTLSGASTYLGSTLISGGALTLAGGANRLPISGTVTVASGATLNLNGQAQTLDGIGGSGSVIGGSLTVTGTVAPGGLGTVGSLTLSAAPTLSGSTLVIDTRGDGTCDSLVVTDSLSLSGLTLLIADPAQMQGYAYEIMTCAGSLTGSFAATPNLPASWLVRYDRTPGAGKVLLIHNLGTLITIR